MIGLGLFDGCSGGQVAAEIAGLKIDKYYASEVDKYAMQITQKNYPDTIQLGDITKWREWDIEKPDLIMGGSPCQGFSTAGKQLNFDDPRSKLFWEFVEIIKFYKPKYFLLENVKMKKEYQDVISEALGVEPIEINSALVSAQNRKRLYWCNWSVAQPEDRHIYLKDILEDGFVDRDKSYCIDACYFKGGNLQQYYAKKRRHLVFDGLVEVAEADINAIDCVKIVYDPMGKASTLTTMAGGHREPKIIIDCTKCPYVRDKSKCVRNSGLKSYDRHEWDSVCGLLWRKLTPLECERLQTLPDNYTEGVSNSQRYKMLGNGWTAEVVAHILRGIK